MQEELITTLGLISERFWKVQASGSAEDVTAAAREGAVHLASKRPRRPASRPVSHRPGCVTGTFLDVRRGEKTTQWRSSAFGRSASVRYDVVLVLWRNSGTPCEPLLRRPLSRGWICGKRAPCRADPAADVGVCEVWSDRESGLDAARHCQHEALPVLARLFTLRESTAAPSDPR
jgi:hypothetical protein